MAPVGRSFAARGRVRYPRDMAGFPRAAWVLAAAAFAAALTGCCTPPAVLGMARWTRDTPEEAFAFARAAFALDSGGDQFEFLHPEFVEEQGLSRTRWGLARRLAPGTFRKAAEILEAATLEGVERARLPTRRGERDAARVTLRTPAGTGVFVLVDDPRWRLVTDDPESPPLTGDVPAGGADRLVRVEGDALLLGGALPLAFPPAAGSRVLRFEIHHDWRLRGIESLEGFEEFLGEVRSAAAEAPAGATQEKNP
jgi:hypothetical protein